MKRAAPPKALLLVLDDSLGGTAGIRYITDLRGMTDCCSVRAVQLG
jgi:hypothetical protein